MTSAHFCESARTASRSSVGELATMRMACGAIAATKRGSVAICPIAVDNLSITVAGRFAGPNIPNHELTL